MVHDIPNVSLANAILACEFALFAALACVLCAYLVNLFLGQLVRGGKFSPWSVRMFGVPKLSRLIGHVPGVSIQFQVVRVYTQFARAARTTMNHLKFSRGAVKQYPACARGPNWFGADSPRDLSVSTAIPTRGPNPVGFGDEHLRHESRGERAGQSLTKQIIGVSIWLRRLHIGRLRLRALTGRAGALPYSLSLSP